MIRERVVPGSVYPSPPTAQYIRRLPAAGITFSVKHQTTTEQSVGGSHARMLFPRKWQPAYFAPRPHFFATDTSFESNRTAPSYLPSSTSIAPHFNLLPLPLQPSSNAISTHLSLINFPCSPLHFLSLSHYTSLSFTNPSAPPQPSLRPPLSTLQPSHVSLPPHPSIPPHPSLPPHPALSPCPFSSPLFLFLPFHHVDCKFKSAHPPPLISIPCTHPYVHT